MTFPKMIVVRLERRLFTGNVETLHFKPGVNLLVGPPNAGKTKWLQTFDYILGDTGDNPYEVESDEDDTGLADKYEVVTALLLLGDEEFKVERRWKEPGSRSKVFVGDEKMSVQDFQRWLLERLGIPLLHFPKGNPMSGQTWPELSFRMLLRHIYRQQRFWGDTADKQPEREQHACLLQFLGVAESIYTREYGLLVKKGVELERLKARREQYGETLNDVARDILADPGMSVNITSSSIIDAKNRLSLEVSALHELRTAVLQNASDVNTVPELRGHLNKLGERRAALVIGIEEAQESLQKSQERSSEMLRYKQQLFDELSRIERAEDAAGLFSDLRITHCPACDQHMTTHFQKSDDCFLCHQALPHEPAIEGLGAVRLQFERNRLKGELAEVNDLVEAISKEVDKFSAVLFRKREELLSVERELEPSRRAVSALTQEEVSAIDIKLGEAIERERQLGRVGAAVNLGESLDEKIRALENEIEPLKKTVDDVANGVDYGTASEALEDGMNEYLNLLNLYKPGSWRHSAIFVDLSKTVARLRVGRRRWQSALGGTDTLYFLMAYHYGLLALSGKSGCHYPGISVIDVPGEFSGEAIADKENFIVQPFIDLLAKEEYADAQLIMTGAAFDNLSGAHFQRLSQVYLS